VRPVGESVPDKGSDKAHSGRLLLRMPRTLHAELARLAEERSVSLNQLIVGLLSTSLAEGAKVAPPPEGSTYDAETQRRLGIALTVNLIVLVLAGAIAIALLIVALTGGF
jgi:hypothetical protein